MQTKTTSVAAMPEIPRTRPIAPWWHTVLVMAAIAGLSIAGHRQHGLANLHLPAMSSQLSSYLTVTMAEWLLIFVIWLALKRRGLRITSLVGGRWDSTKSFFRDLGIAVGYFAVVALPISLLADRFGGGSKDVDVTISPRTVLDLLGWLTVSITAGFCEEYFFRGYLMQQFTAWSGSRPVGIVTQAVFFGLGHAYYNKRVMFTVMLLGLALGLLAHWRKSLRPGMLAHGLVDSVGGIIAFFWGP